MQIIMQKIKGLMLYEGPLIGHNFYIPNKIPFFALLTINIFKKEDVYGVCCSQMYAMRRLVASGRQ